MTAPMIARKIDDVENLQIELLNRDESYKIFCILPNNGDAEVTSEILINPK